MKTWVKEDDTIWVAGDDGATGYSHSKRVTHDLTFKYWDYLAWGAMACGSSARVLSVGFGGGTFSQLLTRWGTGVHGIGIDVDADLLRETTDWVDSGSWSVVAGDFRDVLGTYESRAFDAILVDVYAGQGYVKSAYEEPWMRHYLRLLRPGGRLLLHCIDPTAMLLALNVPVPADLKSPLREWLTLHETLEEPVDVYVIPLWTTYLVWFGPAPNPLSSVRLNPAVAWVDQFFRKRLLSISALPGDVYHPESWTPHSLNALESAMLKNVFQRMPWLEPLIASMFRELGRVLRPRAQYTNQTVDEILDSLQQLGEVPVLSKHHAASFLHALKGDFGLASEELNRLPFRFGGWLL